MPQIQFSPISEGTGKPIAYKVEGYENDLRLRSRTRGGEKHIKGRGKRPRDFDTQNRFTPPIQR